MATLHRPTFALTLMAAAWLAHASPALAQSTVVVTGRTLPGAGVAGFGDTPLASAPLQASIVGQQQLADAGITSIGALTKADASLGDAYNADGYWASLSARGYTLDNRYNYRRDGLPINAETAIALDNKERLELLKGTSGLQAGTSAPGGLVNLVVKRPNGNHRQARIEWREAGSVLGAVDIGQRFGAENHIGLRLNAAYERLDPPTRNTRGERRLLALAGDWQPTPDTLLQAEIESSHQRQPSVAGYSMLGDTVPSAAGIDPRRNLNDQPWRQSMAFGGQTASLRLVQTLAPGWRLNAHALQQRLKNDDRTAFPYGVYDANYNCPQWCDRFARDGSFTYWEFVSDHERRTTDALHLAVQGEAATGPLRHDIEAGLLLTRHRGRFQDQVFDIAGTGRIDGSLQTLPSAGFGDANMNRDERSTELFLRDRLRLGERWQLWAGLRHTRLDRAAFRTSADGEGSLRATRYRQSLSTPWLAVAHQLAAETTVYASLGQGVESEVVPNRGRYTNRGRALPALKSHQVEAGIKHSAGDFDFSLAAFDIRRPQTSDLGPCDTEDSCTRIVDGRARHRGLEAETGWRWRQWQLQAGAVWLQAKREGSALDGVNGTRPVNVPTRTLRLGAEYSPTTLPGLALQAQLRTESDRAVLPYDPAVTIPGWTRVDLGLRWRQTMGEMAFVWRLGVDNAGDRRAWKESPYQFGHVYLYPMAPRTWRASAQATF
jgi:iron complex outermembrane receptor protein